jgi:RNA polymerase sigma factor (sigma-70 family)
MRIRRTRRNFLAHLGALLAMPVLGVPAQAAIALAARAEGDLQAFAALYDHYAPRICAFHLRSGLDELAATHLTDHAISKACLQIKYFDRSRSSFATWLFRFARNARLDYIRRWHRQFPCSEPFARYQVPLDSVDAPPWETRVRAVLAQLPDEQRALVRLLYAASRFPGDIARETGFPFRPVKAARPI